MLEAADYNLLSPFLYYGYGLQGNRFITFKTGVHIFSENLGDTQNSRRQKSDMKTFMLKVHNYYAPLYRYWGQAVAQVFEALCYNPEGRGFVSRWCHRNFSLSYSFRLQYGSGIDSASNRNEYQEYFLGVKVAGA